MFIWYTYFPNDYPDTSAGQLHETNLAEQLKSKFDKRPPAKRCNYVKLGICEPFSYPWEALIKSWNNGDTESRWENMYVLRDNKALKFIGQLFNTKKISFNRNTNLKSLNNGSRNYRLTRMPCSSLVEELYPIHIHSLSWFPVVHLVSVSI
jgi:hypothetical protein